MEGWEEFQGSLSKSSNMYFFNQHSVKLRNPGIWVYKDIESELHCWTSWDLLDLHCVSDII